MPKYDAKISLQGEAHRQIEIDSIVVSELREYVARIAKLYRGNSFHNFNHACRKYCGFMWLLHSHR